MLNPLNSILFVSLVFPCAHTVPASAQTKEDRLLPSAFAKRIQIDFQQDCRAVDIAVTNPKDKWVLTAIAATINYKAYKVEFRGSLVDFQPNADGHSWPLHILPGNIERIYLELREGETLESVILVEARGRESSYLDQAREWLSK